MADRRRTASSAPALDLRGSVTVVTGSGGPLGGEAALALGAANAEVVCLDRSEANARATAARVNDAGGTASGLGADLLDRLAVSHLVSRLAEPFGPPSVLVHVPDVDPGAASGLTALERWDISLTGALTAPWLLASALWPAGEPPTDGVTRGVVLLVAEDSEGAMRKDGHPPGLAMPGGPDPGRDALPAFAATLAGTGTARVNLVAAPAPPADESALTAWQAAFAGALVFLASPAAGGINAQTLRVSVPTAHASPR